MHIDRRFLNWGLFLVLLGAIPLAVQANVLDRDIAARAWQLWPLLIIAAGAGLLLRNSTLHFAGGAIAAATLGLMAGGLLATGGDFASLARSCGSDAATTAFAQQQGSLSGGQVTLEFNCGDLSLSGAAGSGWTLGGTTDSGEVPRIETAGDRLAIRSRETTVGIFGFGPRQTWNLSLPQDPTLDLDITLNAGSGQLALGGTHVGRLKITGNAGSIVADLGSAAALRQIDVTFNAGSARLNLPNATFSGTIQVNAGSVGFCIPEGPGIRIASGDNITGSNNFSEQGLVRTGNTWQSPNYDGAASRIDLTAHANAGSLSLNPKDGCQ